MSDKKKKQKLSPEELGQAAGGTARARTGEKTEGGEPTTESRRTRDSAQAGGALDIEMMRGVSGGVARTGSEAGGLTGRSSGTARSTRGDEEENDGGGILPMEREPRTPN